jgi:hypothetical protein
MNFYLPLSLENNFAILNVLSEAMALKVGWRTPGGMVPRSGRQVRGPERALRRKGERTLSKLLSSDICKAIFLVILF